MGQLVSHVFRADGGRGLHRMAAGPSQRSVRRVLLGRAILVGMLVAATLAVFPSLALATSGTTSVIRVEGNEVVGLGRWNLTSDRTLSGARAAFGRPSSTRRYSDDQIPWCDVRWKARRIEVTFDLTAGRCGEVTLFYTYARSWRTSDGLRVGDLTRRIKAVYPAARFAATEWVLLDFENGAHTAMSAIPRAGRVHHLKLAFVWD